MSFIVQPVQAPSIFRVQSTETGGAAGKVNFDVSNYDILYYEGDASGDFFLNVRGESGTTLSSLMNIGDVVDISLQVTNGGTNKTLQYLEIDDGASKVNLSLPSGQTTFQSYASAITVYDFNIERSSTGEYFVETQITRQELVISSPTGVTFTNVSASLTTDSFSLAFSASGSLSNILYAGLTDTGNMFGVNSASPILVPITAPGTYTLQVGAYTVAGISSLSSASNSLTISVPSAPSNASASATNATTVSVTFSGSAFNGWTGAGITYFAESTPGGFVGSASASPILVSGTYSGSYTFEVYAANVAGISQTSTASNSINILPIPVDYLVVAGGGTSNDDQGVGGGGGGGVREDQIILRSGNLITITVGASDNNSSIVSPLGTISSTKGGRSDGGNPTANKDGGSGAGGMYRVQNPATAYPGGNGNTPATIPAQGYNGGNVIAYSGSLSSDVVGAGGGGAGEPGYDVVIAKTGSDGGDGRLSNITFTPTYYGGGGGGKGALGTGLGGLGGGGDGGVAGSANTGGGGGGLGASGLVTRPGGSGVVILRYPDTFNAASTTGSPTITVTNGYRIYKFNGNGTLTLPS